MTDGPVLEERWWLITQLPPAKVESKADLEILRRVSDEELRRTREANALLNRLASAASYARLVELFQELEQALARAASPQRSAAELNRTARALGSVVANLAGDIRRQAVEDFGEGDELAALEAAIAEECDRAPFRLLVAVGELTEGPFAVVGADVGNEAAAIAALAAAVPEVTPAVNLVTSLRGGVLVAQRLIGRQLEIYRERIDEAARWLRLLAAEVPDGAPALMRADRLDPSTGKLELGQITFDSLALDKAIFLHRALRHARVLLAETSDAPVVNDEIGAPAEDVGEPVSEQPTAAEETPGRTGEEGDVETASPPDPQAAVAEPLAGGREAQVVDLRALAEHVTELSQELERAWSGALEPAALADAGSEMGARLASLLYSIQRRVGAGDRELREAGIETFIPAYPLLEAELARLTFSPDTERRWRQLQLAEVEALEGLLQALKGLQAPSAHRVTLATGEVESWWEAGAFEFVRARVRLLLRVSTAAAGAEAAVMGRPPDHPPEADFFDQLRLAGEAMNQGDPEAALVHGLISLRLRAALAVDLVPDDLLERLAADPRLAPEVPLLRLLGEAAETLGTGRPLDIGAAVLVAPRALALVGRLCLREPGILQDALRSESSGT